MIRTPDDRTIGPGDVVVSDHPITIEGTRRPLPCFKCGTPARWHVWDQDSANPLCNDHAVEVLQDGQAVCIRQVGRQFRIEGE